MPSVLAVDPSTNTPVGKALQRIYGAFTNPTKHTMTETAKYPLQDFIGDDNGQRIEDYAYRTLGKLLARIGRHGYAFGMPQLTITTTPDHYLEFVWTIPSVAADAHLHTTLTKQTEVISQELKWFEDYGTAQQDVDFIERVSRIRGAAQRIIEEGIMLGYHLDERERAADPKTDDPSTGLPKQEA